MARQKVSVEFNRFVNGFITEASPLTFPENASLDEENMNINSDGSRQRRFGMSWDEDAYTHSKAGDLGTTGLATSSFTWKSAGNDGDTNIGVLQHGAYLYFYDLDAESVANSFLTFTVVLEAPSELIPFEYTSAYGQLIVSTGGQSVVVCEIKGSTVTRRSYRLNIRDRFGIDDGLGIDERPTSLTDIHEYNLRNQGWPEELVCAGDENGNTATTTTDPVAYTDTKLSYFPSNADLIWAAKLQSINSGSSFAENIDAYSPWDLDKQLFGTTPAPKGKFILDVFNRGASRLAESGIITIPTPYKLERTEGGISSVSSFAGRLWYTLKDEGLEDEDDKSPHIGNMLLYSQATEDFDRWKACHTSNDPTSEEFSDVLATDGGFISIPESGQMYKSLPLGESLYVFSSNGVWEIFGGESGFSASVQTVVKISDIGPLSVSSIVQGENIIAYWAESGIYSVSLDSTSLRGISTNITEETIQEYYDDIPIEMKKQARGMYDPISRQATWLYNTTPKDSEYYFDKELVLDVLNLAFTKRSLNALTKTTGHGPYPTAYLRLRNLLLGTGEEGVTDGGVIVTDGGEAVTSVVSDASQKTKTAIMYWLADYDGSIERFRLGGYIDFGFVDYPKVEDSSGNFGSDAPAFILTGYLTGGDSSRSKWLPYISVKSKRTESDWSIDGDGNVTVVGESSCLMQAQWEWTNNPLAGKWSTIQQVYRLPRMFTLDSSHTFSFDVINTRNKVKGSGNALSLLFSSEPDKDMYLYGWGVEVEMDESI